MPNLDDLDAGELGKRKRPISEDIGRGYTKRVANIPESRYNYITPNRQSILSGLGQNINLPHRGLYSRRRALRRRMAMAYGNQGRKFGGYNSMVPRTGRYLRGYTYSRVPGSHPELKDFRFETLWFPVGYGNMTLNQSTTSSIDESIPLLIGTNNDNSNFQGTQDIFAQWRGVIGPLATNVSHGFLVPINTPTNGTGIDDRIGNTIYDKSVLVNVGWRLPNVPVSGQPTPPPDAQRQSPENPTMVRTMLIYDDQPNGQLPNINDILGVIATDITGTSPGPYTAQYHASVLSPNNLSYKNRFRTIWDQRDTMTPGGDAVLQYDEYRTLNCKTTYLTGETAAFTKRYRFTTTGAIYLLLLTDGKRWVDSDNVIHDTRAWCKFHTRLRFEDA